MRSGLVLVLQKRLGVSAIEEAADIGACLALLRRGSAGTLLIDRSFLGDMQALRSIRAATQGIQLALLVNTIDRKGTTQLLESGVDAIIPKQLPQDELVRALTSVLRGKGYLPAPTGSAEGFPSASNDHDRVYPLTTRQYQVMRLAMSGKANKEIAHALGIAESTVKIHMSAAFRALGARNRVGAFARLNELELAPGGAGSPIERIDRRRSERRQSDRRQSQSSGWLIPRRRS